MDLIDRYLAAVTALLPKGQRADIAEELRDALTYKIEKREQEVGRKLMREELEAILKEFGNPLVVAGRYRGERTLIGPEMYPFWRAAMLLNLGILVTVHLVLIAVVSATHRHPGDLIVGTLSSAWEWALYSFAIITAIAALMENYGVTRHLVNGWRPRDLPHITPHRREGPYHRVAEMVLCVIGILWLLGSLGYLPDTAPWARGDVETVLSPAVTPIRYALIALLALEIAHASHALVRPAHALSIAITGLVLRIAFLAVFIWLVRIGDFVDVIGLPAAESAEVNASVDLGVRIGVNVAVVVTAIEVALAARRVWRARRTGGSANAPITAIAI